MTNCIHEFNYLFRLIQTFEWKTKKFETFDFQVFTSFLFVFLLSTVYNSHPIITTDIDRFYFLIDIQLTRK